MTHDLMISGTSSSPTSLWKRQAQEACGGLQMGGSSGTADFLKTTSIFSRARVRAVSIPWSTTDSKNCL